MTDAPRTRKATLTVDVEHYVGDDKLTRLETEEVALMGALREIRRQIDAERYKDELEAIKARLTKLEPAPYTWNAGD